MINYSMLIHFDIGKIVSILIFEYEYNNMVHLWINIVHFSRKWKQVRLRMIYIYLENFILIFEREWIWKWIIRSIFL